MPKGNFDTVIIVKICIYVKIDHGIHERDKDARLEESESGINGKHLIST
jgi:hypothetical protein